MERIWEQVQPSSKPWFAFCEENTCYIMYGYVSFLWIKQTPLCAAGQKKKKMKPCACVEIQISVSFCHFYQHAELEFIAGSGTEEPTCASECGAAEIPPFVCVLILHQGWNMQLISSLLAKLGNSQVTKPWQHTTHQGIPNKSLKILWVAKQQVYTWEFP